MNAQIAHPEQADAFVGKLNTFMATLDAHEQGWLVALLTDSAPGAADAEVQGYAAPPAFGLPPFGLAVALPPDVLNTAATPSDKGSTTLFQFCCTGKHFPQAQL